MSVQFWLFLVNTAISTVQKSLLPILGMHWYLTILYAMCIGSYPTAMLQKHILYLLKWTLRLQLFSGPERRGVYSGAATIQGVITHILFSAYYIVRVWRAKWTKRSVARGHHFYKTVWTPQNADGMVSH